MRNSANHYSKLSQSNLIIKLKYNKILRIIQVWKKSKLFIPLNPWQKVFQCDLTNKSNAEIAQAIHDTFVNEYGYDLNDTIILTINAMALNKSASEMLQMIQSGEISILKMLKNQVK